MLLWPLVELNFIRHSDDILHRKIINSLFPVLLMVWRRRGDNYHHAINQHDSYLEGKRVASETNPHHLCQLISLFCNFWQHSPGSDYFFDAIIKNTVGAFIRVHCHSLKCMFKQVKHGLNSLLFSELFEILRTKYSWFKTYSNNWWVLFISKIILN